MDKMFVIVRYGFDSGYLNYAFDGLVFTERIDAVSYMESHDLNENFYGVEELEVYSRES